MSSIGCFRGPVKIGLRRQWHVASWRIWPRPSDILFPPPALLADGEAFDDYVDRFWFELLIDDPALPRV
jgi:hypothetical protein